MPALSGEYSAKALTDLAREERSLRALDIARWWDYYEGQHKRFLKVREGEPDYNTITNLCARVVDQSVNFLVGAMPEWDLPGEDETNEALLDAWWEINDGEDFLTDLMTTATVTGHAFVKLVPEPALRNVRPVALDSSLVTAFWLPEDKTKTVAYMIEWGSAAKREREDHILSGQTWQVIRYISSGSDWIEQSRAIWPYPFAQIVDWKNLPNPRGYYGRSDIGAQVISLNDAYNFRQSNTSKILYIHAHPRTIGFGVTANQVSKSAVDGLWLIPDKEARLENLEMQTDLESSRANAGDVKADFFSDSQTVDLSTVKDKAGALTNFGLKLMFAEALAKNAKKRRLAGRGLSEMLYRVGVLLGYDWAGVTVQWADPLPENTVEQVSNAKEVISMGVSSRQTQAERLGYDWKREQTRIEEEKAGQALNLGQLLANNLRDPQAVDVEDADA